MNLVRMLPVLYVLLTVLESRAIAQLTVKLYNSAHVSPGDLVQAEERAAGIFRQARIKIGWDLVPPPGEVPDPARSEAWNPAALHLRLWTRASVGSNTYGEDTLGFQVSTETGTAIIIADEIRNRSAREFTNPGNLLGLVMAHEMGHLLLRSSAHSVEGIMQATLPTGLRDRRRTLLVFSRQQATVIRAEIHRRTGVQSRESHAGGSPTTHAVHDVVGLAAQPGDTRLTIDVRIYNYARVSPETLARAEQEAARIFKRASVATVWRGCSVSPEAIRNTACTLPAAPTGFTLRLLSNSMADSLGVGGDIFGSALLPDNEGFGVMANAYADRIRELAGRRDFEVILGRVVAHELGHLLLGRNAHSRAGIMQARWREQDLGRSRQAAMLFLPVEAKRIRAQVLARAGSAHEIPDFTESPNRQIRTWIDDVSTNVRPRPESTIGIRFTNQAQVPTSTLRLALQEVAYIFADAGIDMLLRECPPSLTPVPADAVCEQDFGPMILGVQIVPRDERKSTAPAERLFGFALPFNDDGIHATIFYQRTEQAAAQEGVSVGKLLGDIMAHEIGHLFLWSNAHSRAGIMHGSWTPEDMDTIREGHMTFTSEEAQTMKENVIRRREQQQILAPHTPPALKEGNE